MEMLNGSLKRAVVGTTIVWAVWFDHTISVWLSR